MLSKDPIEKQGSATSTSNRIRYDKCNKETPRNSICEHHNAIARIERISSEAVVYCGRGPRRRAQRMGSYGWAPRYCCRWGELGHWPGISARSRQM